MVLPGRTYASMVISQLSITSFIQATHSQPASTSSVHQQTRPGWGFPSMNVNDGELLLVLELATICCWWWINNKQRSTNRLCVCCRVEFIHEESNTRRTIWRWWKSAIYDLPGSRSSRWCHRWMTPGVQSAFGCTESRGEEEEKEELVRKWNKRDQNKVKDIWVWLLELPVAN